MYLPMLASNRPLTKTLDYLDGDLWAQQKLDGMRLITETHYEFGDQDGIIRFWGRDGQTFTKRIPPSVRLLLKELSRMGTFVLDGELVGDTYWIFDALLMQDAEGAVLLDETDPYRQRYDMLSQLAGAFEWGEGVRLIRQATTPWTKHELWRNVVDAHGEGMIFRDPDGTYRQGKRELLKLKLIKSVDAIVSAVGLDGHDNCEYEVYVDGTDETLTIGRCSLSGKQAVKVGDVIEVIYLYATPATNKKPIRLYQPRLHAVRDDKPPEECLLSQIHFTDKAVV